MTKIAAIQMCSSYSVDENLKSAADLIHTAAKNGAKLIVLPEMFAIMGRGSNEKIEVQEPFGHGRIQTFLSDQSKQHGVWIVGGTIPISCENKTKIKAACLVFDDQGNCVARYDKIHLFDVTLSETEAYAESDTTTPGNHITVIDTPFGKLGIAVCYDIRFPELFRILFNKGAEIIAIPAAFTVPTGEAHWELLTRSRAVENFCYVVGACQGGTHANGRKTYGHSLIIAPWGNVIAEQNENNPGVTYAEIDLKKIKDARKSIPIQHHQRIFFDVTKLKNGT